MVTYIGKDKFDMAAHAARMAGDRILAAIRAHDELLLSNCRIDCGRVVDGCGARPDRACQVPGGLHF